MNDIADDFRRTIRSTREQPKRVISASALRIGYKIELDGTTMYAWLMNLFSKIAGNTATINMEKQTAGGNISGENWIGPDGVESGPGVPEDWYLTYDGPAPVVEGIPYYKNYAVDRGNGVVPIDFYIQKWGFPEGFGATDYEKETAANLTNFSGD